MFPQQWRARIWTIPNLISFARLACVPLFLYWMLVTHDDLAAAILLAVLGATDWVDGWIARRFDQGSEFGKVLDPVADRILLVAGAVAVLARGIVPWWVGAIVLFREALIISGTLALALAGARRIDVRWAGKAGTLAIMFALPGFVFLSLSSGMLHTVLVVVTWTFTIGGLILSWIATAEYLMSARQALRDGRASRQTGAEA
ncbi:MAG: CDP-alcohol phosphatidyltransferase family protein [Acidimicrobiia bacterium]